MQAYRSRTGTACWLAVLAVAQLIALVLVYKFFVLTPLGQRLETAALAGNFIGLHRIEAPVRDLLNIVSVVSLAAATVAIGFIALARRRFLLAVVSVVLVAGANVTTQVLKYGVLTRPDFGIDIPGKDNPSLPSGHTTVAASLAVALVMVLPPRMRGTAALVGAGYAGLTGVATLSVGWHRPSDAIAAYLVVGIWAAVSGLVLLGAQTARARPRDEDAHPIAISLLGVVGLGLLAAGVVALVLADRWTALAVPELSKRQLFVSYAGGAAAIAGSAAAMLTVVLPVLHRVVPRYLPR